MEIKLHKHHQVTLAEVVSDSVLILDGQSALEVALNAGRESDGKVIIHRNQLAPEFFDLKSGVAGEVLQKFVNYRVQVALVGDFSDLDSRSWQSLIVESNRGRDFFFLDSLEQALARLAG